MKNIIYGLRDPRNDVYQYIGKSTVGSKRALQHLIKSHSEKVNEWVANLNENWLYPLVDIIEEAEMADKMGVHRSTIVGCENGYNINFDMLQKYVMTLKGIDIISKSCGKRIKKSRKSK